MPVLRYFSSIAQPTTLSGSISAGATSITVGATTGFPTSVPYTLALDYGAATEELVDVTAVAGTTLTVTRGVDGTSAQSHSLGAVVRHVASGRDFADYQTHQAATAAIHGVAGTIVGTSDTQTLSNKTLTSPTVNSGAVSGTFTGTATWTGLQTLNGGVASSGNIGTSAQFTGTGSAVGQDVFRGLVSGDAQNRFTVDADGRLEWGTGAAGRDTDLFRNGVGILQTASRISAQRGTAGELAFHTQLQADTGSRFYVQSGGTLNWGDGAGLVDTNLYRSAADTLKTDDALVVAGELTVTGGPTWTTYTPAVGGGGTVTWTTRTGYYYKVGKLVFLVIFLSINAAGSGAANVTVDAPSSVDRTTRQMVPFNAEGIAASYNGSGSLMAFLGGAGATFDRLRAFDGTSITGAQLSAGGLLTFQGWYREA